MLSTQLLHELLIVSMLFNTKRETVMTNESTDARTALLEQARNLAIDVATARGVVTADDIPSCMRKELGPTAGSIFKSSEFHFTGNRIKSALPANHARELKVWALV